MKTRTMPKESHLVQESIDHQGLLLCLIPKVLPNVSRSFVYLRQFTIIDLEFNITITLVGKSKEKKPLPSHLLSDMSTTLSSSLPYAETTSGLSVSADASMQSGTARHLSQVERYELENFTRMRMSKKDSKKRRNEEEEVAFGGLGAGKGGKRRLGGFGAEFDDLLGEMSGNRRMDGAYEVMKGFKKAKVGGPREKDEGAGTSGLGPLAKSGKKGKSSKKPRPNAFDKAVVREGKKRH